MRFAHADAPAPLSPITVAANERPPLAAQLCWRVAALGRLRSRVSSALRACGLSRWLDQSAATPPFWQRSLPCSLHVPHTSPRRKPLDSGCAGAWSSRCWLAAPSAASVNVAGAVGVSANMAPSEPYAPPRQTWGSRGHECGAAAMLSVTQVAQQLKWDVAPRPCPALALDKCCPG